MSEARHLYKEELDVIEAMLQTSSYQPKPPIDPSALVSQMDDGGMRSIRFVYPDPQCLGGAVREAHYTDTDGVLVSINLNVDASGRLFELDLWKVDFSPLKRYPQPGDLVFKA